MEECLQFIRNIMELSKNKTYVDIKAFALTKIDTIFDGMNLNENILGFISDDASFIWSKKFKEKYYINEMLESPKYKIRGNKISEEKMNIILEENQINAIKTFDGKNV